MSPNNLKKIYLIMKIMIDTDVEAGCTVDSIHV